MADTKITALTAISVVNPATYPLPIVDTSDTTMAGSGTTKKVTVNQILGAGGTATLASASITGDLTVKTNVLKVDTTNNRVGIGTATPGFPFQVVGVSRLFSTGDGVFVSGDSSPDTYNIGINYYNNAGTEGVQVSARPSWRLDHKISTDATAYFDIGFRAASAAATSWTSRLRIDGSGNLGLGVTPSAWSQGRAIELFGLGNAIWGAGTSQLILSRNAYFNGGWKYAYNNATAFN